MIDRYVEEMENNANMLLAWEAARRTKWQMMPWDFDDWSPEVWAQFWAYQQVLHDRYDVDDENILAPVYDLMPLL